MTRKDYERIAEALKVKRRQVFGDYTLSERNAFDAACEAVAASCKAENPLFNRERFMAATGQVPL